MNSHEKLMLNRRAIEALKERISSESYLGVGEVVKRLGVSRALVEGLPFEVLPYVDLGRGEKRTKRRYHPADVLAADGLIRRWRRAQAHGHQEEFLAGLRTRLEERDSAAIRLADEMVAA